MTDRDREIALELKRRLSGIVPMADFKVFGSRARGDADEYSDMDVFIEVETATREIRKKIAHAAWEVGFNYLIHISPLVFTREELENTPVRSSPIVRNIREEGVTV
jgi:predicted nucleotidyltransferase